MQLLIIKQNNNLNYIKLKNHYNQNKNYKYLNRNQI